MSARPTFPATSTSRPAARKIAPSSSVVVVFPFVPVTPIERIAGQQPEAELDLAPHRDRARTRRRGERRLGRDTGAFHDELDTVQQGLLLRSETNFDAPSASLPGVGAGGPVGRDHLHPAPRERGRRRAPRAREPEHERPPRQPVGCPVGPVPLTANASPQGGREGPCSHGIGANARTSVPSS